MKYYELTKEEQEILDAVEKGEFVPVENQEEAMREAVLAARNTLNKIKNINIRLTLRDLQKLKAKANKRPRGTVNINDNIIFFIRLFMFALDLSLQSS